MLEDAAIPHVPSTQVYTGGCYGALAHNLAETTSCSCSNPASLAGSRACCAVICVGYVAPEHCDTPATSALSLMKLLLSAAVT